MQAYELTTNLTNSRGTRRRRTRGRRKARRWGNGVDQGKEEWVVLRRWIRFYWITSSQLKMYVTDCLRTKISDAHAPNTS